MYIYDMYTCLHLYRINIYIYIYSSIQYVHWENSAFFFSHFVQCLEARLLPSEVFGEGSMGAHLQRNASARAWSTALGGPRPMMVISQKKRTWLNGKSIFCVGKYLYIYIYIVRVYI